MFIVNGITYDANRRHCFIYIMSMPEIIVYAVFSTSETV